jgi:two-component system cell cycle response regulator
VAASEQTDAKERGAGRRTSGFAPIRKAERAPRLIAAILAVMVGALALLAFRYIAGVAPGTSLTYDGIVYDIVSLTAAAACLARAAISSRDRMPWGLIGTALLVSGLGDLYYTCFLLGDSDPAYPSPADIGYLAWYPLTAAGVIVLVRNRMRGRGRALWVDGLIGAVTTAAIGSAALLEPALRDLPRDGMAAAVTAAYPIADVALFSLIVGTLSLNGWRVGRAWALLLAGLGATAVGDAAYAGQIGLGQFASADWWQILWPTSCALIGLAAWQPQPIREPRASNSWRELLVPSVFALTAIALLVSRSLDEGDAVTLMAAGAPILVVGRISFAAVENRRLLEQTRTDFLTGLGNRAQLLHDMQEEPSSEDPPTVLALFDLDGFKLYNDTYGHPAGDALLRRLGGRLQAAVSGRGGAFRIGGDEFCVLADDDEAGQASTTIAAAKSALHELGDGFEISCSCGTASLPGEAMSASDALRIADRRMYQQKDSNRASARSQAQEVLLEVLGEREPALRDHLVDVAELARDVALRLGISGFELDEIVRAAKLHDVGKVAIPETILSKPTGLTPDERAFIERHTIFGERIVTAAPALARLGPIIRASHERWDGGGYPDGLKGQEIPLASRIIFACDAYDAIRSTRPYSPARSSAIALSEIRRCSGSQFDPDVVVALAIEVERRELRERPKPRMTTLV